MVLIPHWVVCFCPGSGPRPGEIWPGLEGQQLVTIILEVLLLPRWKKKAWCLSKLLPCLWPIRGVTGREESSWQNLYQPISTTAWHGKTARHSSHRRSVSWLSLCLSGSSATSLLLIVTHLAARHDSAAWRRVEVEAISKSSHCKLLSSHSRNVLRALQFPHYSQEFLSLHLVWEMTHIPLTFF